MDSLVKKKYLVYHNDIKYKDHRNLDSERIIWYKNYLKDLYENEDLDSLDYRLYECESTGMINLDLNNMDLNTFPDIPLKYKEKIKCLFIAENDLEIIPDLNEFKSLEILEISNNKIYEIGLLPISLIELSCKNNKLFSLPSAASCPNLQRLDCSGNQIVEIPYYEKLKILMCSQNRISTIPNLINLEKLICCNNAINYIAKCDKLKNLDCSFNKLIKLENYENLVDLVCSNNNITELISYKKLEFLEIFQTNIKCIPFMENLSELYCNKDLVKFISNKYVSERNITYTIHKENMIQFNISKK
jgi:Leucine-rich repeat (LRR) protein